MAIAVQTIVRISFMPDGAGAMEVPSGQVIQIAPPIQIAAGGNTPTYANISTALDNVDSLLQILITAQLPTIQGWNSGGN